ncbi:hypothetical protein [Bifidobacterium avesanii]|uniref:Uncharacterized protein n=1 Tax=Bifidobacterium avesanii TaxID=1798157 RepID=A0A7K3TIF7_9BIFI|nr:hypothetical protein [Bifidobacterium avesanii]NEG78851.1 hypothetical protein [Bifidobacterium avesanii]
MPAKTRNRLVAACALLAITALALAAFYGVGAIRSSDPTTPERSWSANATPIRYREESSDAREDLQPTERLADESRVAWYHYAPTSDGGVRVFFPASDSCLYRLVVRETSQYVGVTVVAGSAGTAGYCQPSGDSGAATGRYASMSAKLRNPLGNRKAVELTDLVSSAAFPDQIGDGPHFTGLSTDASAIPEVVWARQPGADLILVGDAAYIRADASVMSADDMAKVRRIGAVGRIVGSTDTPLRDWDATQLPAGTDLYATTEYDPYAICAGSSCARVYQRLAEG